MPVDAAALRSQIVKSFAHLNNLDHAVQGSYVIDPGLADAYALFAAQAAGVPPNLAFQAMARLIAFRQRDDGHWPTFDVRPPQAHSFFSSTALAIKAIQAYGHPQMAAVIAAKIGKGRAWLLNHDPETTEDRVFQLLGLRWSSADKRSIQQAAKLLLTLQNKDGGWGQLPERSSDAYATATALFALAESGELSIDSDSYVRGARFLLDIQKEDGSWLVESRLHPPAPVSPPYFESGFPHGHNQFLSLSATSWALAALSPLVGRSGRQVPESVPELEQAGAQPWMEATLFGADGQLEALLNGGLNPNSQTRGGTTALMMAVPDLNKVRLLLSRGAQVHALARSGYNALMVACNYHGTGAITRVLLNLDAEVNPKENQDVILNASALTLAVTAGDAENVKLLIERGADLTRKLIIGGTAPEPALVHAIAFRDLEVVRTLVDAGADIHEVDQAGVKPLSWAVIADNLDAAKLLIAKGARVNDVDQLGMTPLLYAASIDFGSTRMVDFLLGANAQQKAKAAQLAKSLGNAHLAAALSR